MTHVESYVTVHEISGWMRFVGFPIGCIRWSSNLLPETCLLCAMCDQIAETGQRERGIEG